MVKNVTGYDLPKLVAGSWGRLIALTEVTLKVLPRPAMTQTLFLEGLTADDAVAAMAKALGSHADVAAAAHDPSGSGLTGLRLEGFAPSVAARRGFLQGLLAGFAAVGVMSEAEAGDFWNRFQTLEPLGADHPLWRLALPPSRCAGTLAQLDGGWLMDWGGGLVWLASSAEPGAIRSAAEAAGGHAMLVRAPEAMRATVPALHPQPAPHMPAGGADYAAPSIRAAYSRPAVFWITPMQTSFSEAALADPDIAASEAVIRKCVHCGFCTATCPTYILLGDELDSPRGRIYLMKDMLEEARDPTPTMVKHVDRCLSCLSCMTTCPSGVNYMHLVDHARAYIEERYRRPLRERLLRWMLARLLPHPGRFRLALALARLAKPVTPLFAKAEALKPISAMLALVPERTPAAPSAQAPEPVAKRGRVVLLQGCVEPVLRPEIRAATMRLLSRAGFETVFARGEVCCGALVHHMGRKEEALAAARRNVDAWMAEIEGPGAGCHSHHRFGLRRNAERLWIHAARGSGLCRKGGPGVGPGQRYLRIPGDDRPAGAPERAALSRRLSRRLRPAAWTEDHRPAETSLAAGGLRSEDAG